MARFYSSIYGLSMEVTEGGFICRGPARSVQITTGVANQLGHARFSLSTPSAWLAFRQRVQVLAHQPLPDACKGLGEAITVRDPDGNQMVFTPPVGSTVDVQDPALPPATLQHFALRTPNIADMLAFYTEHLGFVVSDFVRDPEGNLRACFLRVDGLHHALALFLAPMSCFDHQSFETLDWAGMKTWGDHMAARRVPIVWGIGRHGPGNDVFFMVRDPDGNLVEISSEIEHCAAGRPAGEWAHEERTLNLWGKAILRS